MTKMLTKSELRHQILESFSVAEIEKILATKKKQGKRVRVEEMKEIDLGNVRKLARKHGYREDKFYKKNSLISFVKNGNKICIWYTTRNVCINFNYNKSSNNMVFKRNVTPQLLDAIFKKPLKGGKKTSMQYRVWSKDEYKFINSIVDDETSSFSMTNKGFISCEEVKGEVYWTEGVPKNLQDKLRTRAKNLPRPVYAVVGSGGRYFVEFRDGKYKFESNNVLLTRKEINKNGGVKHVSFGDNEGKHSCWVKYCNDSMAWENLPESVSQSLSNTKKGVDDVRLGSNGQVFARYSDYKTAAWGLAEMQKLDKAWDEIEEDYNILTLDFGTKKEWVIQYVRKF